jgi:hypothetical protein
MAFLWRRSPARAPRRPRFLSRLCSFLASRGLVCSVLSSTSRAAHQSLVIFGRSSSPLPPLVRPFPFPLNSSRPFFSRVFLVHFSCCCFSPEVSVHGIQMIPVVRVCGPIVRTLSCKNRFFCGPGCKIHVTIVLFIKQRHTSFDFSCLPTFSSGSTLCYLTAAIHAKFCYGCRRRCQAEADRRNTCQKY